MPENSFKCHIVSIEYFDNNKIETIFRNLAVRFNMKIFGINIIVFH